MHLAWNVVNLLGHDSSWWWFHWLKNRVKKDICNNIVSYISQLRHPTKQMRSQWYTSEITSDFPHFQTCTWFSALQMHREWKHTSHDSWFIRMTKPLCYSPNRAQYRRLLQPELDSSRAPAQMFSLFALLGTIGTLQIWALRGFEESHRGWGFICREQTRVYNFITSAAAVQLASRGTTGLLSF